VSEPHIIKKYFEKNHFEDCLIKIVSDRREQTQFLVCPLLGERFVNHDKGYS
jgi:hypothetical protein